MARKSRKVDYVNVGNKENLVTEAENQCEISFDNFGTKYSYCF